MRTSAKEMTNKFKDDIVEPVAKGAAAGSEKFAKGSEALADGARKMADKTQDWADEVTGSNRRRNLILIAVLLTIIGAVVGMLVRSDS
jgi:X-X-X-Leu-X-X-Gly heptad repeat protein